MAAARDTQDVIELLTLTQPGAVNTQNVIEFLVGVGVVCNNPPAGQVGVPYSHAFLAGGGTAPYTFSISAGSLPLGLVLAGATGVASGMPIQSGVYPFTVQVIDSLGDSATVNCSISIGGASIVIVLYGYNLVRVSSCDEFEQAADVPPVKRVL